MVGGVNVGTAACNWARVCPCENPALNAAEFAAALATTFPLTAGEMGPVTEKLLSSGALVIKLGMICPGKPWTNRPKPPRITVFLLPAGAQVKPTRGRTESTEL